MIETTHTPETSLDPRFSTPGASPTPWSEALTFLRDSEIFWLATDRNGQPHLTPIAAVVVEDRFFFCSGPDEQKAVNLSRNDRCTAVAGSPNFKQGLDVVLEGRAVRVTDESNLRKIAAAFQERYSGFFGFEVANDAFSNSEGGVALVFELEPSRGFGFARGDVYSQTRWTFRSDGHL